MQDINELKKWVKAYDAVAEKVDEIEVIQDFVEAGEATEQEA